MPLPAVATILWGATLTALLKRILLWLLLAKGAAIVIRLFGVLGIAFFTTEYVINPVLDLIQGNAAGVPAQLRAWLSAFGIDRCISIVATAYLILAGKRVLLGKRA